MIIIISSSLYVLHGTRILLYHFKVRKSEFKVINVTQ